MYLNIPSKRVKTLKKWVKLHYSQFFGLKKAQNAVCCSKSIKIFAMNLLNCYESYILGCFVHYQQAQQGYK